MNYKSDSIIETLAMKKTAQTISTCLVDSRNLSRSFLFFVHRIVIEYNILLRGYNNKR